jgi:DNA polymerase
MPPARQSRTDARRIGQLPRIPRRPARHHPAEYICCLGATAAKNLLNTEVSISKLRGKFADYRGIKVMCTYHPAYLLRNPAAKRDVWEDMKSLMRAMGVDLDKKA